jgi:hypothetical protein
MKAVAYYFLNLFSLNTVNTKVTSRYKTVVPYYDEESEHMLKKFKDTERMENNIEVRVRQ